MDMGDGTYLYAFCLLYFLMWPRPTSMLRVGFKGCMSHMLEFESIKSAMAYRDIFNGK